MQFQTVSFESMLETFLWQLHLQHSGYLRYKFLGILEPDMVVMLLSVGPESELLEILPESKIYCQHGLDKKAQCGGCKITAILDLGKQRFYQTSLYAPRPVANRMPSGSTDM